MRRLYSTFACGWPGVGLILMRLVVGSALVVRSISMLWRDPPHQRDDNLRVCSRMRDSLIVGLWTPIVGTFVASIELWRVLTMSGEPWIPLFLGPLVALLQC